LIEKLGKRGLVAGKDFFLLGHGNELNFQKYNMSLVTHPMGEAGIMLGRLVCLKDIERGDAGKTAPQCSSVCY
jgi:hypothetical protein